MNLEIILSSIGAFLLGAILIFLFVRPKTKIIEESATREAERIRKNAEKDANRILEDGKHQVSQLRQNAKKEEFQLRDRLQKMQDQADERIAKKEHKLEEKVEKMDQAREDYEKSVRDLDEQKEILSKKLKKQVSELEKISKLSESEAKQILLKEIEEKCEKELANTMHKKIEMIEQTAEKSAAETITQAIQRYAAPVTSESTVSIVKIDSDDIKGKIIGREGRNINAFELLTGVDLIVDDTPGAITISCFDIFRRYIAKLSLEELIKDGRIHPSKIEESVKKAEKDADKMLLDLGQKASYDLGVSGFPDQILKLVGRLRFRTSYGQNVLNHSMEVAYIAEAIANEIPGADPLICKRAGLVHDIGKAISHEVEGGHAIIGVEILEKFGIDKAVIDAMKSHHEDFPYESIESRILQAADAISASRPGARRETIEKYIKRLKELEGIAGSFAGVEKVFAIQAGREVRVFVNSKKINDLTSEKLSFDIARKIENSCQYPGEVKVSVIRESRYENSAK